MSGKEKNSAANGGLKVTRPPSGKFNFNLRSSIITTMPNGNAFLPSRDEHAPLCSDIANGLSGEPPGNTEDDPSNESEVHPAFCELDRTHLYRLYISHFLSTRNTRTYEFAAVSAHFAIGSTLADACEILFFAKVFRNTLLPTSIR